MALEVGCGLGIGFQEEAIVETYFSTDRVCCANPVDCPFDFTIRVRAAALAVKIRCALEF